MICLVLTIIGAVILLVPIALFGKVVGWTFTKAMEWISGIGPLPEVRPS